MDKKNVVKRLLDSMFENNEMLSGTIDVKSRITHFHIRFDNDAMLDSDANPVTYVKKAQYHVTRDKDRSESYKQLKRERKQTKFYDASKEEPRSDNHENVHVSTTGLSPISVHSDTRVDSPPFCLSDSPDMPQNIYPSASLFSGASNSDRPTSPPNVHDIVQVESTSPHHTISLEQRPVQQKNSKLPKCLDTALFKAHLDVSKNEWSSIKCFECEKSVHDCSKPRKNVRMTYCNSKDCLEGVKEFNSLTGRYHCWVCRTKPPWHSYSQNMKCAYCEEILDFIT